MLRRIARTELQLGLHTIRPPSPVPFEQRVDEHGPDDDRADHDLLQKRRDAEQVQAVSKHAHDERADQRSGQRALPSHQARAADDRRGDGVGLRHHPGNRLSGIKTRGQDDRGHRAHQTAYPVDAGFVEANRDAREAGGLLVAAYGVT